MSEGQEGEGWAHRFKPAPAEAECCTPRASAWPPDRARCPAGPSRAPPAARAAASGTQTGTPAAVETREWVSLYSAPLLERRRTHRLHEALLTEADSHEQVFNEPGWKQPNLEPAKSKESKQAHLGRGAAEADEFLARRALAGACAACAVRGRMVCHGDWRCGVWRTHGHPGMRELFVRHSYSYACVHACEPPTSVHAPPARQLQAHRRLAHLALRDRARRVGVAAAWATLARKLNAAPTGCQTVHTLTCIHTHIHTHACTHSHANTHARTHPHTNTHTRTHARTHAPGPCPRAAARWPGAGTRAPAPAQPAPGCQSGVPGCPRPLVSRCLDETDWLGAYKCELSQPSLVNQRHKRPSQEQRRQK